MIIKPLLYGRDIGIGSCQPSLTWPHLCFPFWLLPFRFQRQLLELLVWRRQQRLLLLLVSFLKANECGYSSSARATEFYKLHQGVRSNLYKGTWGKHIGVAGWLGIIYAIFLYQTS